MEEFAIKTMRRPDLDVAIEWASREGWNPGLHDAEEFYRADPNGFFAGFASGIPVACISSVAYGDSFGFLGLYIVKPEFRGRGFGIRMWEKALEYLGGRNVGLDGVVKRQADYEKYGFRFAHRNLRFAGSIPLGNSENTTDLKDVEIEKVIDYDSQMFPAKRDHFISRWASQKDCKARGYFSDGRLVGYGVARPCVRGFKIGPLFADNIEIAQELLSGLASSMDGEIIIDVPEPNLQAMALVEKLEMKKVFETVRMYNRNIPRLPLDRIYGVTTLELG